MQNANAILYIYKSNMAFVYYNPSHKYHAERSRTHPEDPARIDAIMRMLEPHLGKALTLVQFNPPHPHPSMVESSDTPSWDLADGDTYKTAFTDTILGITRNMIDAAAADLVEKKTRCAFVLCRPPGHHASPDSVSGFCHENNAWYAIQNLVRRGLTKIAVYDWDVHYGDGTMECLTGKSDDYPGVKFCSTHAFGKGIYPGAGAHFKDDHALILPFPKGTKDGAMLKAFQTQVLPFIGKPDVIVVSAGYDGHCEDPMQLMKLSTEIYGTMSHALMDVGCPVLFLLEGGYNPEALGQSVLETLKPWIDAAAAAKSHLI